MTADNFYQDENLQLLKVLTQKCQHIVQGISIAVICKRHSKHFPLIIENDQNKLIRPICCKHHNLKGKVKRNQAESVLENSSLLFDPYGCKWCHTSLCGIEVWLSYILYYLQYQAAKQDLSICIMKAGQLWGNQFLSNWK